MRGDVHVGCGGRAGETHREQSRQGAPVRPNRCCARMGRCRSLAELSLAPEHRRGHGACMARSTAARSKSGGCGGRLAGAAAARAG